MQSPGRPFSSVLMAPSWLQEQADWPAVSAFSPEFRLLLACCVWPHSTARAQQVSYALQSGLDWEQVLRLTARHRVTGLVHHAFSHLPKDAVPERVKRNIADQAVLLVRQNLQLAAESVRVARLMENAGIPVAFLKGIPLAIVAYDGLSVRHSKDIDLLVSEEFAPLAARTLVNLGYQGATAAERMTTDAQVKRWLRDNRHIEYLHENSGINVELHVRMFANPLLNQAFGPECWEPVLVGGVSLISLKRQELFLYLCLHGAMHGWFRLKWLADIGALLKPTTEGDIQQWLCAAEDLGIALPVLQAMQLSSRLLGTPPLERGAAPSWREKLLTRIALHEMGCESEPRPNFRTTRIRLCPYLFRSDWHYLRLQVRCDSTSEADRQLLPLPGAFSFLYAIVRPFLWISRRFARVLRYLVSPVVR